MALCVACHNLFHKAPMMSHKNLRRWQKEAADAVLTNGKKSNLVEACPAAGKTTFAGYVTAHLMGKLRDPHVLHNPAEVDFVLIVVPTTAIKKNFLNKFAEDFGIQLTIHLKPDQRPPQDFDGAVVTYQQLVQGNIAPAAEVWRDTYNVRLMTIFDEIHHASEGNLWGQCSEQLANCSVFNLSLTGTPFRNDSQQIRFIDYNDENHAVPDYSYNYTQALKDRICREIYIQHDDGVAKYTNNNETEEVRITESTKDQQSKVSATVFAKESEFLRGVITKAQTQLEVYQAEGRGYTPACLVICRVGRSGQEDKPVRAVARKIAELTGEEVEIVTHDDPDADEKIDRFRDDRSKKWICAVRKISEGVDIPRLRVMVMATATQSELLFRQMVGRIIRVKDHVSKEHSTLFMARFEQMEEFAVRLEKEAALIDEDDGNRTGGGGDDVIDPVDEDQELNPNNFIPHDASYEEAGGIFHGEFFEALELQHAEDVRARDSRMNQFTADQLALIIRTSDVVKADPPERSAEPLHTRKKKIRKKINKLVNQLGIRTNSGLDPLQETIRGIWRQIFSVFRVKSIDDLMDNQRIERMEQVKEWLEARLREINN